MFYEGSGHMDYKNDKFYAEIVLKYIKQDYKAIRSVLTFILAGVKIPKEYNHVPFFNQ